MHKTIEEAISSAQIRAHATNEPRYVSWDYAEKQYVVISEQGAAQWGWKFVEAVALPSGKVLKEA